jgi:hypothetical protein
LERMGGENATLHGWVGMCMHPRPRKRRPGGTFSRWQGRWTDRGCGDCCGDSILLLLYGAYLHYGIEERHKQNQRKQTGKNQTLLIQLDPSLKENNGKSRDQRDQPTFHKQRKAKPQNPTLPPSNPVVLPLPIPIPIPSHRLGKPNHYPTPPAPIPNSASTPPPRLGISLSIGLGK